MDQLELRVSGMSCTGCEQRVRSALARVDGVLRSTADHTSGRVAVVIDPAKTTEDAVHASMVRAGYEVSR